MFDKKMQYLDHQRLKRKRNYSVIKIGNEKVPLFAKHDGMNDYGLYFKWINKINCIEYCLYMYPYFETFTIKGGMYTTYLKVYERSKTLKFPI